MFYKVEAEIVETTFGFPKKRRIIVVSGLFYVSLKAIS